LITVKYGRLADRQSGVDDQQSHPPYRVCSTLVTSGT
jgi:hypothetical protein